MSDLSLEYSDAARDTGVYGDLMFGPTGDLVMTNGIGAVRQSLLLRLQASINDYFMAPNDGVPWIQMLASTSGYTDSFDAVLRSTTQNTVGVEGLLSWNVTLQDSSRVVHIEMEVSTATGTINFSLPISENGIV